MDISNRILGGIYSIFLGIVGGVILIEVRRRGIYQNLLSSRLFGVDVFYYLLGTLVILFAVGVIGTVREFRPLSVRDKISDVKRYYIKLIKTMRTVFSEIYEWVTSRFCSGTSDKERIKRTIADKPELVEEGLEWIQEDFVKTEYDPNFQFHFFGQDKDGTDVVVMVVPKITHFYNGPHRFMESAFNKNVRRIVVATHIPEDVRNHLEIEGYEWNLVNINSDIEESYFEELRVQICNLIQGTDSS